MCFRSVCERTIWNFHTLIKFFFFSSTPANNRCFDDSKKIWTETISIALFCVTIAIIEGIIFFLFFFQTKYVPYWSDFLLPKYVLQCLLQLIGGWLVAIICQVQYMLFWGEKKKWAIFYYIFYFHRGQAIWMVEGSRITRPGHKIDKFPWRLELVSNCDYGFLSYTQFWFQRIQWWSACTDKTMGFSVRAESVVELQLSCNVIHVKTSIENPKLPRD